MAVSILKNDKFIKFWGVICSIHKEEKMNKEELVKEVAKKSKLSQKAVADVLAATL